MRRPLALLLLLPALLPAQTRKKGAPDWDQIYLNPNSRVPVNPSALVLETTANLSPGLALDAGMGNGRNALYLARKGWKVTGVDISQAAVKRAREQAASLKADLDARSADLEKMDLGRARFDLILCTYAEPLAVRAARKFVDALKPGGLLLIEGRRVDPLPSSSTPPSGFLPNQLLRLYARLHILRYEDRIMPAEWSDSPDTRSPVVRLVARKP